MHTRSLQGNTSTSRHPTCHLSARAAQTSSSLKRSHSGQLSGRRQSQQAAPGETAGCWRLAQEPRGSAPGERYMLARLAPMEAMLACWLPAWGLSSLPGWYLLWGVALSPGEGCSCRSYSCPG